MTVFKSKRGNPATGYLKDAHDLRLLTIKIIKKFPTSYRWIISNNILELSTSIYTNSLKAETVRLDNRTVKEDIKLKHDFLSQAVASCHAIIGEITFVYELIQDGNNFFSGKEDYAKKFHAWMESASKCLDSIYRALDTVKGRFGKAYSNNKKQNHSNHKKPHNKSNETQ